MQGVELASQGSASRGGDHDALEQIARARESPRGAHSRRTLHAGQCMEDHLSHLWQVVHMLMPIDKIWRTPKGIAK